MLPFTTVFRTRFLIPLHPQSLHHFISLCWAFPSFLQTFHSSRDEGYFLPCILTCPPVSMYMWSCPRGWSPAPTSGLLGSPDLPWLPTYLVLVFVSCQVIRKHQPLTSPSSSTIHLATLAVWHQIPQSPSRFQLQLTPEQYQFKRRRSTYRQIFFNAIALHDLQLVASVDAEPIGRNHIHRGPTINYTGIFHCAESGRA